MEDGRCKGDKELLKMLMDDANKIPLLSREEEAAAAREAQGGDKAARDLLVEANVRFVVWRALKFYRPGRPLMDMIGEGFLGLLRAVRTFDPSRGVRFITYAGDGVTHGILRAIADHKKALHLSLDAPLFDDEEDGETFLDRLAHEEPDAEEECLNENVRKLLDDLSEKERALVEMRFFQDKTMEQAGEALGVGKERARQIEGRALRKIRWAIYERSSVRPGAFFSGRAACGW